MFIHFFFYFVCNFNLAVSSHHTNFLVLLSVNKDGGKLPPKLAETITVACSIVNYLHVGGGGDKTA